MSDQTVLCTTFPEDMDETDRAIRLLTDAAAHIGIDERLTLPDFPPFMAESFWTTLHAIDHLKQQPERSKRSLFTVLAVRFEPSHIEQHREYWAGSLREALALAKREDAPGTFTYGIVPEDYEQARAEGIRFNEADGLLM